MMLPTVTNKIAHEMKCNYCVCVFVVCVCVFVVCCLCVFVVCVCLILLVGSFVHACVLHWRKIGKVCVLIFDLLQSQ